MAFLLWFLTLCINFKLFGGCRGRDHIVVGFTTTYAIGPYHHWCCGFNSRSGRGVQHYVIKFVSDLRQVNGFLPGPPVSFNNKSDCHNITELLLKVALNNINQNKPNVGRMHGDIYGYGSNLMSVRWGRKNNLYKPNSM